MNTHVPVRLPVCHMHANVYLETRIHIYKRMYVLHSYRQTYIRKRMHTYVRMYGLMDRQTDAPVPACQMINCYANWRKYKSTENKKILLLYDSQEHCVFLSKQTVQTQM